MRKQMNIDLFLQNKMQKQIEWAVKDRGVYFVRHLAQGYIKQAFHRLFALAL